MPVETFDDVLKSIKKNAGKRNFYLLLGNGFSMAYDPEIFSYNALHDFIANLDAPDFNNAFGVGTNAFGVGTQLRLILAESVF